MILNEQDAANALSDAFQNLANDLSSTYLALRKSTLGDAENDLSDAYRNRVPTTPGAFKTNGVVYQVKASKGSDRVYAKVLRNGEFVYEPGAIYKTRESDRLTMEQAIEESALLGACIICGRTLSDPKSVAKGIGPVCAKRVAA